MDTRSPGETSQKGLREQEKKGDIRRTEMTGRGEKIDLSEIDACIFGTRGMAVLSLRNGISRKTCWFQKQARH